MKFFTTNRAIELIKSLPRNINGRLFNIGSLSSFEKSFNRAVARARIEDFKMHDTRHLGATFLAQKGWTTQELMAQGGRNQSSGSKQTKEQKYQ